MYCHHCGKQLPAVAKFCPFCGVARADAASPRAAAHQPSAAAPAAQAPAAPLTATPSTAGKKSSAEFTLGARVFTGIGIVAVLFGVGFFLRYAFEHDLISEPLRVAGGVVFGVVLMGIGHYLKRSYRSYGLSLVGTGGGVIYLSLYAAYAYYQLIGLPAAFALLLSVSAIVVALSAYYESLALAICSIFGAFFIVFLLPLSSVDALCLYLFALNAAAYVLAHVRRWPQLLLLAFGASVLALFEWSSGDLTHAQNMSGMVYETALFAAYAIASIWLIAQSSSGNIERWLAYLTPVAYTSLMLQLVADDRQTALLMFGIAAFYALAFAAVRALYRGAFPLAGTFLVFAFGFFALSAMFHFADDETSISIVWAAEAAVALAAGLALRWRGGRITAAALASFSLIYMLLFDLETPDGAVALLNHRTLVMAFFTLVFASMYAMYRRYRDVDVSAAEQTGLPTIYSSFAFLIPLLWVALETVQFADEPWLKLPAYWALYAFCAIMVSLAINESPLRYLAYGLAALAGILLITTQYPLPEAYYHPLFNIRVASIALYAALSLAAILFLGRASTMGEREKRHVSGVVFGFTYFLGFWLITAEVLQYFNQPYAAALESTERIVLSAAWLAYGFSILLVGFFWRSVLARYAGIALLSLSICKIFLYDTADLSDIYRFVSFMTLGLILLAAGYAYWRFKERIMQFVSVDSAAVGQPSQEVITP